MNTIKDQRGLIKEILIIVVALVILGALGFNIQNVVHSPMVQSNLSWFWNILLWIWSIIASPIIWLWNLFLTLLHAGVSSTQ